MSTAIGRLKKADYEEIRAVLCPYCRYGIPDISYADSNQFVHVISEIDFRVPCLANTFRRAPRK